MADEDGTVEETEKQTSKNTDAGEKDMAAAMAEEKTESEADAGEMDMAAAMAEEKAEGQGDKLQFEDHENAAQATAGVAAEDDDEDVGIARSATDLEAVYDIPVNVSAILGRAHLPVSKLLKLGKGAVVELDRKVGEAIDVYVNNRLVARGEVVVVEDHLGITMTEIIKSDKA